MDINQVWPEWNEDCVLGEGSFGKVYRAKRVEYGRTFYSAIKVLTVPKNQQEIKFARSQGMNDSEIYDYFRGLVDNLLNEITLMENLKGAQNIVGIEDYKIIERQGEIGWDIFIRMELLTPFDNFVSNPEFSQKDVIKLGVDICTALEFCEQNYVVHRDIKPDNIFISRFGEYKLGDFGIARKLETTQANLSRKGTLNYMAPEVYKSEEYGTNVDIYSLGLVLYTLLNNNRIAFLPPYPQPISYKDNEEALSKRLSGMPVPYPCNANASLGAVIVKACAYRPQDRFQTATEFKNALLNEWNVIVQSGDNRGLRIDAMNHDNYMNDRLRSTTNDMTANGRLVVDEYASQDTTVLNSSMYNSMNASNNGYYNGSNSFQAADNNLYTAIPVSKASKVCSIIAMPLAAILAGLSIFTAVRTSFVSVAAILGFALIMLIARHNKIGIGLCVAAASLSSIVTGLHGFIEGMKSSFSVEAVVILLFGFLMLSSGIAIAAQREVRFGGSLCLYALAVLWLYNIYQLINSDPMIMDEQWILMSVGILTTFIWSCGYNRNNVETNIKKILSIVTYVLSGIFALISIVSTVGLVNNIF